MYIQVVLKENIENADEYNNNKKKNENWKKLTYF